MLKEFQIICAIEDITATGDIIKFRVPFSGVLKQVDLWSNTANTNGDNVFNLNVNGSDLFAGGSRPKITQNATTGQLAGLSNSLTFGHEVILQLESIATGGVKANLVLQLTIDDGVSVSGSSEGILAAVKTSQTEDDEFEGSALNTSKWTKTGSAAVESFDDKIRSAYFARFNTGQNIDLEQLYSPGSSDCSFTLCGQMETLENFNALVLRISDSSGNNAIEFDYIFDSNTKFAVHRILSGSYTYNIATAVNATVINYPLVFLHVQRVAGTWYTYFSHNGLNWTRQLNNYSHSFTVGKIFVRFGSNTGATQKVSGALHWFRRNWLFL